jgi:DNA replication and repair protein RecF
MTRLAILTLRLARFRSYELASVAPEGASVALHGSNGAGKTNILEAVSLLVPGRGLRRAGIEEMARRPGAAGWRVRAEVETPQGVIEIATGADAPDGRDRLQARAPDRARPPRAHGLADPGDGPPLARGGG